jgi:hypothetical protein
MARKNFHNDKNHRKKDPFFEGPKNDHFWTKNESFLIFAENRKNDQK